MTDRFSALFLPVDKPGRMVVRHPYTLRPLADSEGREAYIDFLSDDSEKARVFERAQTADNAEKRVAWATLNVRERALALLDMEEADMTARLASLAVGWHLVGLDGSPVDVECNEAEARYLFAERKGNWLRQQAIAWRDRRANFAEASSKD